jgi:hypothetical protein
MTAMLPTRPKYAREHLTFNQSYLDHEVEAGHAKFFPTTKGDIYVLKYADGTSIKVTPEMIVDDVAIIEAAQDALEAANLYPPFPEVETVYSVPAAPATLIAAADAEGISVGEYTDGEYRDPRPSRKAQIETRAARLDSLLDRWS